MATSLSPFFHAASVATFGLGVHLASTSLANKKHFRIVELEKEEVKNVAELQRSLLHRSNWRQEMDASVLSETRYKLNQARQSWW